MYIFDTLGNSGKKVAIMDRTSPFMNISMNILVTINGYISSRLSAM